MTDTVREEVAKAIRYELGHDPDHVTDPMFALDWKHFLTVGDAAIAAYTKAVSGEAVGLQFRSVFFDGTYSDWTGSVMGLPLENRSHTETRPVFAAQPAPAVPAEKDDAHDY